MRTTGQVKWFDDKKGFGFIRNPNGKDIFVHYKNIETVGHKTLVEDQDVSYQLQEGNKGPVAIKVQPL